MAEIPNIAARTRDEREWCGYTRAIRSQDPDHICRCGHHWETTDAEEATADDE